MPGNRIAVFEGYGRPFRGTRYGAAPRLMNDPIGRQRTLGELGRRAYYVPREKYVASDSRGGYGPGRKPRKAYRVKRMKDTPAMKRAQRKFTAAAKKCSRKTAKRGSFQACMRAALKKRRSKR